jgi:hypothetical protein
MGMDVYGENPILISERPTQPDFGVATEEEKTEYFNKLEEFERTNVGYYFRNNVWWWRPLWEYVCQVCPDVLSEEDREAGHSNSGYLYDASQAEQIAKILQRELILGKTLEYQKEYEAELEALPQVDCPHCEATGTRNDQYVQGTCNACHGTGKQDSYAKSYPFDIENVQEFQRFVEASGGFRVC